MAPPPPLPAQPPLATRNPGSRSSVSGASSGGKAMARPKAAPPKPPTASHKSDISHASVGSVCLQSDVISSPKVAASLLGSNNNNANKTHSSVRSDKSQSSTTGAISTSPKFSARVMTSTVSCDQTSHKQEKTLSLSSNAVTAGRLSNTSVPKELGEASRRSSRAAAASAAVIAAASNKTDHSVRRQSALIRSTIEKLSADATKFEPAELKTTHDSRPPTTAPPKKTSPTEPAKRFGGAVIKKNPPPPCDVSKSNARPVSPAHSLVKSRSQSPVGETNDAKPSPRMSIASVSDLRKNFESSGSRARKQENAGKTGAVLKDVSKDAKASALPKKEPKACANISAKQGSKATASASKTTTTRVTPAQQKPLASANTATKTPAKSEAGSLMSVSTQGSPKRDARGPMARAWLSRPSTPEAKHAKQDAKTKKGLLASVGRSLDAGENSSRSEKGFSQAGDSKMAASASKPRATTTSGTGNAAARTAPSSEKPSWLHAKQTSSESLQNEGSHGEASMFRSTRQKSSDCITMRQAKLGGGGGGGERTKPRERSLDSMPAPPSVPPRHGPQQKSATLGPSHSAAERKLSSKSATLSATPVDKRASSSSVPHPDSAPPLPPKSGKREESLLATIEGSLGMTLAGEQVAAGNDWPEENPRSLEFLTGRSHEAEDILDGAGDGDGDREKVLKMKKANSCSGMMGWKSIFSIWGKGAGEKPEDGEQEAAELPRDASKSAKTLPSRRPPAPPPPNEHQAPDDHFYWYIEHGQMASDSSSTSGDAGGSGPSPNQDQYYSSINDSSADTGKADSCKSDSGIDVSALCPTTDKSKDSNFIRNLFCLAPATTYATTVGAIPPPLPPARSKKGAVDGIMHDVLDKSKSLPISRVTKDDIEICRDLGPGTASLPPHIHLPSLKNEDMIYMDCDEAAFAERPSDSSSEESADELDDEQANRQKEKRTFYIAQEMATSERTFVDVLRLLNEDFRGAVLAAGREKGKPVVPEETLSQVLMHLPQLQNLNSGLADDLAARIATWDKRPQIADVFVKFGPFLKLHASYIKDFAQMTQGLDDACKKYPAFAKAVKEFEMSSLCCNLALKHYMLKPVQRIPQYRLLLQDYLKYLPDRSPDKKDTRLALQIVTDVASHANETIKKEEKFEKLFQLQERLLGGRIIVKPGRVLLKQGEVLNISRKEPQMRNLFLLNDVLLYAVPLPNTMYRLSAILPLSGMKVVKPALEAYENEFHIITVERSFTFATRTPSEREEWIVAIAPAVIENAEKRSTFKTSRTTMAKRSIYEKDGSVKLGTKAPIWIPETRVTMCMMCTCDFGVRSRRHHCRACGKVVCSTCASNKAPLLYRKYQSARVCGSCYDKLWTDYARMRDEDVRSSVYEMKDDIYGTVGECYGLGHDDLRTRFKKADTKKKVRHMPQRLKEVCANDAGSAISGYLHKRVKKGKWQRLWFVVKDKVLYSYKASEDVAALDATPLLGFNVQTMDTIEVFEGVDASLVFELWHHRKSMFIFHTDAASARERWVTLITEQTVLV